MPIKVQIPAPMRQHTDGLERAQPRGQAVIGRRSAVLERGDRGVGVGDLLGRGLERVVAPLHGDLTPLPGATREDAGREGQQRGG